MLSLSSPVAVDCSADFFAESDINEVAVLAFCTFLVMAIGGVCNWNASVPPMLVDEKLCIRIRAAAAVATDNIEVVSFRIPMVLPAIVSIVCLLICLLALDHC